MYFSLMQQLRAGNHGGGSLSSTYCVAFLSSMDAASPSPSWQKPKESLKDPHTHF